MGLIDIVVMAVLALILGFAVCYIRRAKKKGVKCIGCPHGGNCYACSGCAARPKV